VFTIASQFITSCPPGNPSVVPPLKAFPTLTTTPPNASPGQLVTYTFNPAGALGGNSTKAAANSTVRYFAAYYSGLNVTVLPLLASNRTRVPPDLKGTFYTLIVSARFPVFIKRAGKSCHHSLLSTPL
jgi:hypothetical protein